jgi:hypothetical protein
LSFTHDKGGIFVIVERWQRCCSVRLVHRHRRASSGPDEGAKKLQCKPKIRKRRRTSNPKFPMFYYFTWMKNPGSFEKWLKNMAPDHCDGRDLHLKNRL